MPYNKNIADIALFVLRSPATPWEWRGLLLQTSPVDQLLGRSASRGTMQAGLHLHVEGNSSVRVITLVGEGRGSMKITAQK